MSSSHDLSLGSHSTDPPTILVVDDNSVDRLVAGRLLEKQGGWRVVYAGDGDEALKQIARMPPHVVVADLQMPGVDGFALVEQIREQFPRVPVVLMTGQGSEEAAMAALRAGAASYVPKRNLATELIPAIEQVLSVTQTEAHRHRVLGCLTRRTARFLLDNDPTLVAPLVALLREDLLETGLCNENTAMRAGIALEEALLNAVYHGNLEVSSHLKLDDEQAFHKMAARRRNQMPYRERRVRVIARLTPVQAVFIITDQGPGFDIRKLPDPDDSSVWDKPSGRGLMLMRMFMDEVHYNPTGNSVTLVKRRAVPTDES